MQAIVDERARDGASREDMQTQLAESGRAGAADWFPEALFAATVLVFTLLWIALAHRRFLHHADQDWDSSEWMIDYAAGFVRRGFAGTLTERVMRLTGWGFFPVWITAAAGSYYALCAWLMAWSRRTGGRALWRCALLFNPLLLICACEYGSFARKDMFFVWGTLLHVLAAQGAIRRARGRARGAVGQFAAAAALGALALVLALLHEGLFVFDWLPLNLTIGWYTLGRLRLRGARRLLLLVVVLTPALAAVAASLLHHGDTQTALTICRSWRQAVPVTCSTLPPALEALGWSVSHALALSLALAWKLPFYAVFLAAAGGLLVMTVQALMPGARTRHLAMLLVLPFLVSLPLYFLGVDWGRWLSVMACSALVVMLSDLRPAAEAALPRRWRSALARRLMPRVDRKLGGIRPRIERERWALGVFLVLFAVPQIPFASLLLLDLPVMVVRMIAALAGKAS